MMCKRLKTKKLKLLFSFTELSRDFILKIFPTLLWKILIFLRSPIFSHWKHSNIHFAQHSHWDFPRSRQIFMLQEWEPSQFFLSRLQCLQLLKFKVKNVEVNIKKLLWKFFVLCKWNFNFLYFMLKGEQLWSCKKITEKWKFYCELNSISAYSIKILLHSTLLKNAHKMQINVHLVCIGNVKWKWNLSLLA